MAQALSASCKKLGQTVPITNASAVYASTPTANFLNLKNFDVLEWDTPAPHLAFAAASPDSVSAAREWVAHSASDSDDAGEEVLEDGARLSVLHGSSIT